MSLTSELKNSNSLISQLFKKHLPNTRALLKAGRDQMKDKEIIRAAENLPWMMIGTAFDYRLRFYFSGSGDFRKLVAYLGFWGLCGESWSALHHNEQMSTWEVNEQQLEDIKEFSMNEESPLFDIRLARDFVNSYDALMANLKPAGRKLQQPDEDLLLRHCCVLAYLDGFYRPGSYPTSPLLSPDPSIKSVNDLLSLPSADTIEDLRLLSWGFFDEFQSMLSKEVIANPTFEGSRLVGGADADLIIEHCLLDIKTTINPFNGPGHLYQLLGYAVLDIHDKYNLTHVGFYFSRQKCLVKWSLREILSELSAGEITDLAFLRAEIAKLYSVKPTGATPSKLRPQ